METTFRHMLRIIRNCRSVVRRADSQSAICYERTGPNKLNLAEHAMTFNSTLAASTW
jgi:hypothetical protein